MAATTEETESGKTEIEKVPVEETENGNVFQASECPVEKVVVYQDRAEVCRIIETKLKKGENEVILKNLSQWVDQDSIRVEGKGQATILEVTYQSKHINPSDEEKEGIKTKREEFARQLKVLESKLTEIKSTKARVEKQWKVLDQFSNSVTKMGASVSEQSDARTTVTRLDKTQLDGISEFFKLYDSQSTRLDMSLLELDREIERVDTEKATLMKNMKESGIVKNANVSRECSILLESQEPEEVDITLLVSYVVSNASWAPKYDIRVFPEEKKLKVMYYGVIKQSTDEDWEDSKLFLSTAMPSIGGTVPALGRASVQIKRNLYAGARLGKSLSKSFSLRKKGAMQRHSVPQSIDLGEVGDQDVQCLKEYSLFDGKDFSAPVEVAQTQAKEGLTSTTFEITRPSSIPCDNVGHKVAVGIIDLAPEFEYESVPKLAPHAFLKARVTNNSQYAFLPGPTNIFLDNNFVAKSELKAVSPAEEFVVSLGVDPAVRITYKPLNKFQEKSGLLTKIKTLTYKQDIEIKNTHTDAVHIKVVDHVPVSTEDKIKVNILEPALTSKHPEKVEKSDTMKLTKENHIEWELTVAGKEQREITLKYTVEHPAGEEVDTWTSPL